ncbi:glucoside xylosyltransferase 1 [Lingula anatina]|uniref:UDP-D-xylose:beta-D-glucoside alpha-1,3-D-xylosyltransferase n=1 Tax=Lingula anatina TaxID=7574 RepID=A0A1S3H1M4_LINAN|nr:glucoside xylosyltransferase 1 [Lingula anatina]|eukprot:XP_013379837.1 glucoside xylosyltransferase 1 [Lingula anatina]
MFFKISILVLSVSVVVYYVYFHHQIKESEEGVTDFLSGEEDEVVEINATQESAQEDDIAGNPQAPDVPSMHLAVVACGDRLEETLVMIKSALILSRDVIKVHIFAEYDLHLGFKQQLDKWLAASQGTFTYQLYPITYPENYNVEEWKKVFKPCATQRLFLPYVMKDVDSLLYVDTDILFMRPFDDIWSFFKEFNSSHIAALAPEHMDGAAGWYNRFAMHPYYGPLGMNSGVMLMNLTRMRKFPWIELVTKFYEVYKLNITWGDQDLINIVFHFHPDKLFELTCDWNYRPDHCMYMSVCKDGEKEGISVVHGNRGVYHNDKQPVFKAVYEAFKQYNIGDDLRSGLLQQMRENIDKGPKSNCGDVKHIFTKQLEKQVTLFEERTK